MSICQLYVPEWLWVYVAKMFWWSHYLTFTHTYTYIHTGAGTDACSSTSPPQTPPPHTQQDEEEERFFTKKQKNDIYILLYCIHLYWYHPYDVILFLLKFNHDHFYIAHRWMIFLTSTTRGKMKRRNTLSTKSVTAGKSYIIIFVYTSCTITLTLYNAARECY